MGQSIQAVILDYGEVISQAMRQDTVRAMARILDVDVESLKKMYWQFRDDYDLGKFYGKEYWHRVANALSRTVTDEQVQRLMNEDIDTWKNVRPEMIDFIRELRDAG